VGAYAGAHMARAGEDVTFIDPRRSNVETMKAKGLQVLHIRNMPEWSTPVLALHLAELQQAAKERPFHIAFVCVKSCDTRRLLHQLLPATDGLSTALRAVLQRRDIDALRTKVLTRQGISRATARKFRLLLYVTSLLLVALLLHLGMQLRARALALYRRAAFEHSIAGISTR